MKKTTKIFGLLLTLFGLALVTGCTPITDTPDAPEEIYTVTFNTNGGTEVKSQMVESGKKATKPANPTKQAIATETYSFENWYTSTDNGATLSDTAFDFDTVITKDITLYAKWTANAVTYTVTVDVINGTVSADKTSAKVGELVTLTITPENGYELENITVNNGAVPLSGEGNTRTFTMPARNVTVSATFKKTAETINQEAADVVIAKIKAIGTVEYTDASKSKIEDARTAYNALNEVQKALVSTEILAVLTTAETQYSTLKTEAETAAANQNAANAVIAKINTIGTVAYTSDSKALIDAARNAYNALTSDQKDLVTNYSTLTDAESTYESLIPREYTIKFFCKSEGEVTEFFNSGSDNLAKTAILTYLRALESLEFISDDTLVISDLDQNNKLNIIFNSVANCYGKGSEYTVDELPNYVAKYSLISSESGYNNSSEIILTYEYQLVKKRATFK